MEALKFAFDTLIIGALALPWLWLFMRLFFQRGTDKHDKIAFPLIDLLSPSTQDYVGLALIIGIGYFLGSAISRISNDFFDDDELLPVNRVSIQKGVYLHEYCDPHSVVVETQVLPLPLEVRGGKAEFCKQFEKNSSEDKAIDKDKQKEKQKEKDAVLEQVITEVFSLQESKLLLEGEEKLGRVREFHDQIEILRGTALNSALVFALSWFGLCKLYRNRTATVPSYGKGKSGPAAPSQANLPVNGAQNESPPKANNPPQRSFFARIVSPSKLRVLLRTASYLPAALCWP